jgi:plastocyanin
MSQKRLHRVLLPVLVLGLALSVVAVAMGAGGAKGPKKATIRAMGKESFKANKFFKQTFHYHGDKVPIASGGTVTIVDKIGQDHTFSLVKRSDLPKTIRAANSCYDPPSSPCINILNAHGGSDNGPPTNPVVNVGGAGFDQAGDSVVVPAKSKNTKVQITAKAGTKLYFLCAIHPQMQGEIDVKK